jgi:hypothetical protein
MFILDNAGIEGSIMRQENLLRAAIDATSGTSIAVKLDWFQIPPDRRDLPADGAGIPLSARLCLSGSQRRGPDLRGRDTMFAAPCSLQRNRISVREKISEFTEDKGRPSWLNDKMDGLRKELNQ